MSHWDDIMAESEPYPHIDVTMPRSKSRTWVTKGQNHVCIRRASKGHRNHVSTGSFTLFREEAEFIVGELEHLTEEGE